MVLAFNSQKYAYAKTKPESIVWRKSYTHKTYHAFVFIKRISLAKNNGRYYTKISHIAKRAGYVVCEPVIKEVYFSESVLLKIDTLLVSHFSFRFVRFVFTVSVYK